MPRSSVSARRGFTLVELLIGIVLVGIIGAALTRTLVNMQRGSRAQNQRVVLQGNMRAGMALLPSELRELSPDDLVTTLADQIEYRAMRSTGIACGGVVAGEVHLRDALTFGYRAIVAGRDGLYLFVDKDEATAGDDTWREMTITATAAATCPDGDPATRLTITPADAGAFVEAEVLDGAPVRTFEQMEMRLYQGADSRWWLGARSVNTPDVIQPVLGPLAADSGLVFTYLDRAGNVTATKASMRTIVVDLRGETDAAISGGYGQMQIAQDGLRARIRLRNAPAF